MSPLDMNEESDPVILSVTKTILLGSSIMGSTSYKTSGDFNYARLLASYRSNLTISSF